MAKKKSEEQVLTLDKMKLRNLRMCVQSTLMNLLAHSVLFDENEGLREQFTSLCELHIYLCLNSKATGEDLVVVDRTESYAKMNKIYGWDKSFVIVDWSIPGVDSQQAVVPTRMALKSAEEEVRCVYL